MLCRGYRILCKNDYVLKQILHKKTFPKHLGKRTLCEDTPTKNLENDDKKTVLSPVKAPEIPVDKFSDKPFYHKPRKIDYNIIYTKNTSISASRAISDYLLTTDDLAGLRQTKVRTAYNESESPADQCYLKLDVEKRWGHIHTNSFIFAASS